jgi:tetratricopeptide (TPR) repeat protein
MGEAKRRKREREEAIASVSDELRGLGPQELLQRAIPLADAGQWDDIVPILRAAVSRDPDFQEGWAFLGAALHEEDDNEGAARALARALSLDEEDVSCLRRLAQIMVEQQDWAAAEKSLRAAIALDEKDWHQWFLLGLCWEEMGEDALALVAYDEALRQDGNVSGTHAHRGSVLMLLDRTGEAEAAFREALRLDPTIELHVMFGAALMRNGKLDEAEQQLRTHIASTPEDVFGPMMLAEVLALAGRAPESEAELRRLEDAHGDDEEVLAEVAELRERLARGASTVAAGD